MIGRKRAANEQPREQLVVSVDNKQCHLYGICEHEAPEVFQLSRGNKLHYEANPSPASREQTLQAARICPMQAIHVRTGKS